LLGAIDVEGASEADGELLGELDVEGAKEVEGDALSFSQLFTGSSVQITFALGSLGSSS